MLLLKRRTEEKIIIGGNVVITICNVRGDYVTVGIEAPREVPVVRSELLEETEGEG